MSKDRIKANYIMKHITQYVTTRMVKEFPGITEKDIRKAIRRYFELCIDDLTRGNHIYFGAKLGNLYVVKEKREIKYDPETDQIINTLPVNIAETLKLWKARPELRKKKFIRYTNEHSDGYMYRLKYEVSMATFKGKQYYNFKYSKPVREKLNENINNKNIEVFLNKYE